jgi:hypothetical protein
MDLAANQRGKANRNLATRACDQLVSAGIRLLKA